MVKLTLKHPLTFGKTEVKELVFRDYTTAADYLSFDVRGGVAQRIALIASLTGTDESMIQKLRGIDYRAAEKMADKLLEADEEVTEGDGQDAAQKKLPAS